MSYLIPSDILQIPNTLNEVSACWKRAEQALQRRIKNNIPGASEESITVLFYEQLAAQLRKRSRKGAIAGAFLADLIMNFPDLAASYELFGVADGLIADVTLHGRETEKMTGGDLGLIIVRPQVIRIDHSIHAINYGRGILCQAKLKNNDGKWGRFTKRQQEVLPQRLSYLSLLLYSYKDAERHRLCHFQWHICQPEETIEHLEKYLKTDSFPPLHRSDTIIHALGCGAIGTDDEQILCEIISHAKNPTLIIKITWPDGRGDPPGSFVYVYSAQETETLHINTQAQQI